ncbi:hypothetical protein K469DRAFT_704947 [Zopfia rhizophila CBS 207.26]|uniref:RING-type domain-containing protein n=1 Tax=Zopfia rhizophila CBS 207.26 TaxID=1314779 RepID=A0A6A6E8B6_9PEZI|nr:hypothetical protein K469DRAFT_704947 [Zopfia rhizophila CBS 207.26]
MGTLTADCPCLDSHCPHKLATSCRLTSTPNCCACADERPHSQTYSVYIDGVGFVQRGTRWQSYCWFCKEFWNNRLAATYPPLEPSQTQIPQIPGQTEFLERWFEFYQGYRIVKRPDGTEQRIAVIGEPLKEVSPGFLPRTLDQLRAGRLNDATRAENRFRRELLESEEERAEGAQQGLEDALDSLLEEASDNETEELRQVTEGGEGISEMPFRRESTGLSRPLSRTEIHLQRARERVVRVFGSREEVQSDDYQSPISSMFSRAWGRYRQAEERRASGDTSVPTLEGISAQERREIEEQLVRSVLRESQPPLLPWLENEATVDVPVRSITPTPRPSIPNPSSIAAPTSIATSGPADLSAPSTSAPPTEALTTTSSNMPSTSDLRPALAAITAELSRLRQASEAVASARHALHSRRNPSPPAQSLDSQPNRPPPLSDEEMTKNLACQICYSQLADTAVLPCGHMIMCQWCADVVIPVRHSHLPVRPSKCPMCRKQVKQRFKIHMG